MFKLICISRCLLIAFTLAALTSSAAVKAASSDPADLAPLDIKLPLAAFVGTPPDLKASDRIEPLSDKPRPPFLAPKGCANVALKKKVTSSDKSPLMGNLEQVTDGDKDATDESYVELHRKAQWVQIDLGNPHSIYAVLLWHAHSIAQVYHGVVVQLADDPDFTRNVRTIFNNDLDNEIGLGIGSQKEYVETNEGKLIAVKGERARYVRLYSKGSTLSQLNRYTEVEVYALRGDAKAVGKD